jgi:hypothetical protein
MESIFSSLPALAGLIEKGGIVGVLLIACGAMIWEIRRLRKDLTRVYAIRDKWRTGYTICKAALDFNKITVDLSMMQDVEKEDAA